MQGKTLLIVAAVVLVFVGLGPWDVVRGQDEIQYRTETLEHGDAAVANYRQTVLAALQQVEDSLAQLRILAEEAEITDRAVKSAQHSLEIFTAQYREDCELPAGDHRAERCAVESTVGGRYLHASPDRKRIFDRSSWRRLKRFSATQSTGRAAVSGRIGTGMVPRRHSCRDLGVRISCSRPLVCRTTARRAAPMANETLNLLIPSLLAMPKDPNSSAPAYHVSGARYTDLTLLTKSPFAPSLPVKPLEAGSSVAIL
jgi:hypothetical protein